MVFTQVGIPLEAIALVAGVDRIMDMARTTINVLGDATGALFVSKLESEFRPRTRRTARCGRITRPGNLPGRLTPRKIPFRGGNRRQTHAAGNERIGIVGGVGPHAGLDSDAQAL